MKYWHVYYCTTDKRYKLRNSVHATLPLVTSHDTIAVFAIFDMAYDYIGRMNNTNMTAYTRGTR